MPLFTTRNNTCRTDHDDDAKGDQWARQRFNVSQVSIMRPIHLNCSILFWGMKWKIAEGTIIEPFFDGQKHLRVNKILSSRPKMVYKKENRSFHKLKILHRGVEVFCCWEKQICVCDYLCPGQNGQHPALGSIEKSVFWYIRSHTPFHCYVHKYTWQHPFTFRWIVFL